jgi:hypothetical protein
MMIKTEEAKRKSRERAMSKRRMGKKVKSVIG